jgi:tRNA-2-methylthio-N6-dimethylallyladenosine synthase
VPAARLEDDVPLEEKKRRLAELIKVQEDTWNSDADAQIGEIWTAVVESEARRPAGSWRLRTANNRKVVLHDVPLAVGEEVRVRVTGWANTTFTGEITA